MISCHKFSLLVILLACGAPALCQTAPSDSRPISEALQVRDYDRAIALSQSALQQTPGNPQLWTLQGIAYASKGDSKEGLAAFQHALSIAPNNIAALAGAAQIQYQSGSQDAVPLLNHLLQLRPGDPTASAMLAVLEYRKGNCKAAAPNFERAAELVDSQIDAVHAYATCLVRLKRFDDAVTVFRKAVALRPGDAQEVRVLASIQLLGHKPQDAIATLRPLVDSKAADAGTLQLISRAYEDAGDTPQAVATLRQAILLDPKNTTLYLDFANVAFAHQSFQVGIDVITEGLLLQPKADELYVARGVLCVQLAQYEKAESDFEKAYELNPNQSMSTAAQGLAAEQSNDFDRALSSIQQKLARNPKDPLLLYLQADILTQRGGDAETPQFRLAMKSAKQAVALQPTLAPAHAVLAKLYMQTQQYSEAIAQCRQALAIDPKDQTALYRLTQALRGAGQVKEIPELLSRLAQLREQATDEDRQRNRYRLLEDEKPENQ